MTDKPEICENIRKEREAAGLTQDEIAAQLGMKRTTYANWETRIEPKYSELKLIASILHIPVQKLVGEDVTFSDGNAQLMALMQINEARARVTMGYVAEIFAFQRGVLAKPVSDEMERQVSALVEGNIGEQ